MYRISLFVLFTYLLLLYGCAPREEVYLRLPQVEFIEKFDTTLTLQELKTSIDAIGNESLKVLDSVLIVGHVDHWSFFSLEDERFLGTCLSRGQGPDEFLKIPKPGAVTFYTKNDTLVGLLPDPLRHRIMSFNISRFLYDGKVCLKPYDVSYLNSGTWEVIAMDTTSVLFTMPNFTATQQLRMIGRGDSVMELPVAKPLNAVEVSNGDDMNILSQIIRYSPTNRKVVEGMISLNAINLYSVDSDWGKTLCVGKELWSVTSVENTSRFMRIYTYGGLSCWDAGFGALWVNRDEISFQQGHADSSVLHFYNWEGYPVAKALVDRDLSGFDIDFERGILYGIDRYEDIVVAYSAKDIVEGLKECRYKTVRINIRNVEF